MAQSVLYSVRYTGTAEIFLRTDIWFSYDEKPTMYDYQKTTSTRRLSKITGWKLQNHGRFVKLAKIELGQMQKMALLLSLAHVCPDQVQAIII